MSEPMRFAAKVTAPLARPLAGRRFVPIWAIVESRGRRSGQAYRTPVAVARTADGFMIPIPFGEGTQWVKNVLAAGGCGLRWAGRSLELDAPEVVDGTTETAAFNRVERSLLGTAGVHRFLRLHEVGPESAAPAV